MILTRDAIRELARANYPDLDDGHERLFAMLVDVADVYLQAVEAQMPRDTPDSPFLGGAMPIEVLINGLEENLIMRQDEGNRIT